MENKVETTPSVFEENQGENPQKSKLWLLFLGITFNRTLFFERKIWISENSVNC
jgi:hypothetical protein